ncbi:hypothetical protein ACNQ2K_00210 [Mycoplasma sp. VS292A]|uniref:hypothetical protein n=1 Tax=Mycoplasma sp. VS292A TaxID=3401680 RepID=UPI003AB02527
MKKLKLPNFGELGMDLKRILWKNNPETYKDFYNLISKEFNENMIIFLKKHKLPLEMLQEYQQILLYMNFVNYRKEKQLMDALNKQKWNVSATCSFIDMKYKIDLEGTNAKKEKVYIQVKPKEEDLSSNDLKILVSKANKDNAIAYIAFKKSDIWQLHILNKKSA